MSSPDTLPQEHAQVWPEVVGATEQISLAVDSDWLEREVAGDEILKKLWENVQIYAYDYTQVVCEYLEDELKGQDRENLEDRKLIDEARHYKHNAFIDSLNILARNMKARGKDGTWVEKFQDNRIKKGFWAIGFTHNKIIENLNKTKGANHG